MKIKETLTDLVESKEELDQLLSLDYLYISRAKYPDDNGLGWLDTDHYDWGVKLRGPHEGPAKIANNKNNHEWFHGYVYGVSKENVFNFEKEAVLFTLEHGYIFERIDVADTLAKEANNFFNTLFEVGNDR